MPIWRNPPNLTASPKKSSERGRERGNVGKKGTEKIGEREGGNTRTKEQGRHTQKSGNQSLGCSERKHPNEISNDPGRLLPICFNIPSPAQLVECRLRMIPVLKTLKSINNTKGTETTAGSGAQAHVPPFRCKEALRRTDSTRLHQGFMRFGYYFQAS